MPPWSSGLGHRPLKAATRVRIPSGVPYIPTLVGINKDSPIAVGLLLSLQIPGNAPDLNSFCRNTRPGSHALFSAGNPLYRIEERCTPLRHAAFLPLQPHKGCASFKRFFEGAYSIDDTWPVRFILRCIARNPATAPADVY